MKLHVSLIVATLWIFTRGQARANDEWAPPQVFVQTTQALASIDKEGGLVVRYRVQLWKLGTKKAVQNDKERVVEALESKWIEQTIRLTAKDSWNVSDATGKQIDRQALPALLKKETPVLLCLTDKADPQQLRILKSDTVVVCVPPPMPEPGRLVPVPGDAAAQDQELKRLRDQLAERDGKIRNQEKELAVLRGRVAKLNEIQVLLDKLLDQSEETHRRLGLPVPPRVAIKINPAPRAVANPPPGAVWGRIKEVKEQGESGVIGLGSENGLEPGHTLEVFRVEPEPRYVGLSRVETVRPKESVVRLIRPVPGVMLRQDDHVASDLKAKKTE